MIRFIRETYDERKREVPLGNLIGVNIKMSFDVVSLRFIKQVLVCRLSSVSTRRLGPERMRC